MRITFKHNFWQLSLAISSGLLIGLTTSPKANAETGGVPLHGFADVSYASTGPSAPDDQRYVGFGFGNLDLFLTPDFEGHKVKSLFEVVLETGAWDGGIGIDVERGQIGYAVSDHDTVWMGRFHTPYGTFNTSYHHGIQLMPTAARPRMIDFEDKGGVLPAHSTGIWWHGYFEMGNRDRLVYDFYAANGSKIVPSSQGVGGIYDFNMLQTDHPNTMKGANLGYAFKHGWLDGLTVGAHGYTTTVNSYLGTLAGNSGGNAGQTFVVEQNAAPNAQANQTMTGGYLFFENDRFALAAEVYNVTNENRAPGQKDSHNNTLYFVETDVNVGGAWRPFLMFEQASLDSSDFIFQQLIDSASYSRTSAGIRYDLNPEACVKVGWAGTNQWTTPGLSNYAKLNSTNMIGAGNTYYDKVSLQYAIRF